MKKILFVTLVLITSIFLISCGSKDQFKIIENDYSIVSQTYNYKIDIIEKINDEQLLNEIVNNVVSEIYNDLFEEIGFHKRVLIVEFIYLDKSLGEIKFDINKSNVEPGLSLIENNVKLN